MFCLFSLRGGRKVWNILELHCVTCKMCYQFLWFLTLERTFGTPKPQTLWQFLHAETSLSVIDNHMGYETYPNPTPQQIAQPNQPTQIIMICHDQDEVWNIKPNQSTFNPNKTTMMTPPGHNSVGLARTLVCSICTHLHGDRVKSVLSKKYYEIFDLIKIERIKDLQESVVLCLVIYVVVLRARQHCWPDGISIFINVWWDSMAWPNIMVDWCCFHWFWFPFCYAGLGPTGCPCANCSEVSKLLFRRKPT